MEHSVRSVLNQSFRDFELIVVDDGSTDNSLDIVKKIRDDRIVIIEQENGGPSKTRNTGVRHAQGEWIVFLDADDELLPDALTTMFNKIQSICDIDILCCDYQIRLNGKIKGSGKYLENDYLVNPYKQWFFNKIFPRTGNMFMRKVVVEGCPFNEVLYRYEDVVCFFRMFIEARWYTYNVPVLIQDGTYSEASRPRANITKDFVGHLDFKGKNFWERMCLFQLYLGERDYYPEEMKKLYPHLHRRYDLLLLYKILLLLKRFHLM